MKKVVTIVIVWLLFLQGGGAAAEQLTAKELLDKYAENQDKIKSFIIKCETVEKKDIKFNGKDKYHSSANTGKRTKFHSEELRYDGHRIKEIRKAWGDVAIWKKDTPKTKSTYNSWLWDTKNTYQYSVTDKATRPNLVILTKGKISNNLAEEDAYRYKMSRGYQGGPMFGYLIGDDDRLDIILKRSDKISLKEQMEKVNDSNCYVIDAVTKRGKYKVWIDPEHGYNIAKAQVIKNAGDRWYEETLLKGCSKTSSVENTRFETIDGVWIPMEGNIKDYTDFAYNSDYGRIYKHCEAKEIFLNPDHDKLKSFLPDDIENGSRVMIPGLEKVKYIWRDAEVIDKDGKVVLDCKKISAEMNDIKGKPENR